MHHHRRYMKELYHATYPWIGRWVCCWLLVITIIAILLVIWMVTWRSWCSHTGGWPSIWCCRWRGATIAALYRYTTFRLLFHTPSTLLYARTTQTSYLSSQQLFSFSRIQCSYEHWSFTTSKMNCILSHCNSSHLQNQFH